MTQLTWTDICFVENAVEIRARLSIMAIPSLQTISLKIFERPRSSRHDGESFNAIGNERYQLALNVFYT
jgi:hypothetical protein